MRAALRNIAMYSLSLYFLPHVLSGFHVSGGFMTYLFGGMVLTLMSIIIRPVLNIVSFPLNVVSLGLFSAVANVLILYLLTILVPNISVHSFLFPGMRIAGFVIPQLMINDFFAFVFAAFVLSAIISFINWLNG